MELIATVLADAFLLWETKSASGSCRRCAPTASITWPVFDAFALSEKGYRVTSMFHLGRRPRTKRASIRDRRMVCLSRSGHVRSATMWATRAVPRL